MEGDTTNTPSTPIMPAADASKTGFNAMLVVVILAVIVLIAAGWVMTRDTDMPMENMMAPESGMMMEGGMMMEQDAVTEQMKVQGTSDEVTAIEADLNATNLDSLKDINQI